MNEFVCIGNDMQVEKIKKAIKNCKTKNTSWALLLAIDVLVALSQQSNNARLVEFKMPRNTFSAFSLYIFSM